MSSRALLLLCTVLALSAAGCGDGPPSDRPGPVGRTQRSWSDAARPGWDGARQRPLRTTIWYPAEPGTPQTEVSIGPPGLPIFLHGWVAPDGPPASRPGPSPLVLLSHGTGGGAEDLSWLAEWLAAHGYLVAAVTHHGNSISADDVSAPGFFLWWERATDLTRALDALLTDETFGPRIDRGAIGVAGFSLGGHTAVLLAGGRVDRQAYLAWCAGPEAVASSCSPPPEATSIVEPIDWERPTPEVSASIARSDAVYRDPRIAAAYAIAPAIGNAMTAASLAAVRVPLRIVVGEDDRMAPPGVDARYIARHVPGASLLELPGVDHYTFLPTCGWLGGLMLGEVCAERADLPRAEVHRRVRADALAFFDGSL